MHADVAVQNCNSVFNIDISSLGINKIVSYTYEHPTEVAEYKVTNSNYTNTTLSTRIDTNYGYYTKYPIDYMLIIDYE